MLGYDPSMTDPRPRRELTLVAGAVVVAAALVLWRYQGLDSLEPVLGQLLVILWLMILTAACWGAGRPVWQLLGGGGGIPPVESWAVVLALGAGAHMAWALILALLGMLHTAPLALFMGVWALVGGFRMWTAAPGLHLGWMRREPLPTALVVAAMLATVTVLRAPSPHYDQLHYHLAFPAQWLKAGEMVSFPGHAYSTLPANMGLLYVYGLAVLGPWAAQAIHWWAGAVAVGGVYGLARRMAGPRAGLWAAAILACCPAVMSVSTWAGSDLGLTLFAVAAWALASSSRRWRRPERGWMGVGALVGLAVGCKYVAGLTVALPVAAAALLLPGGRRLVRLGLCTVVAVAVFSPWAVRNLALNGNPVHPYLSGLLAAPADPSAGSSEVAGSMGEFPAELPEPGWLLTLGTFAPKGDAGAIGPVFLALGPVVLWCGLRRRREGFGLRPRHLLMAAAVGTLGWMLGRQLGRYLIPILALVSVVAGVGWKVLRDHVSRPLGQALTALVALAMVWGWQGGLQRNTFERMGAAWGCYPVDEYMTRDVSYWSALEFLDSGLPPGSRLLLVAEARSLYIEPDVVVEDPFREPYLTRLATAASSSAAMAATLERRGITHLLVNHQEAARQAEARGRRDYFGAPSPAVRGRIEGLFRSHLERVWFGGPVEVYRVMSPPG